MSARWAVCTLLLLLALTPAVAAQGPLSVPSRAPLELFGDVGAAPQALVLYHHAWEDGTLSGVLHRATLIRIDQAEGGQATERIVATFDSTDQSSDFARFALTHGSFAILTFPQGFEFQVGRSGVPIDEPPEGDAAVVAGPNPARTVPSDEDAGVDPFVTFPAMPSENFVAMPRDGFNSTRPFELTLHQGNLTITRSDGRTDVYRARVRTEYQGSGELPPPVGSGATSIQVLTTYRLNATFTGYAVRQDGAAATLDYWHGRSALSADDSTLAPGQWPRTHVGQFAAARQAHGLPATVLGARELTLTVTGVARMHALTAGLPRAVVPAYAAGDALDVGGTLVVSAGEATDAQRSMTVTVSGPIQWASSNPDARADPWHASQAAWVALGGLAAVGAGAWLWPLAKLGFAKAFLVPLYARIHRDEVLEHPVRDDILGTVATEPGISASELGRRMQCGWGTLVYHLAVLERERLIWSAREGRHRRFFAQGRINYSDRDAVGLLRNAASRRLAEAVRLSPGIIQKDLSRHLALSPSTVAWHVERLVQAGLVVKAAEGRQVRYFPSQRLETLSGQLTFA